MPAELTDRMIATIKGAARKLTRRAKRQFQAQLALDYLDGSARQAETAFLGWGREAVEKGLHELHGLRQVATRTVRDNNCGTRNTEERLCRLEEESRSLVEPEGQADPKFQSPFAYARMTAAAVRKTLIEHKGRSDEELPTQRTLRRILNRPDFRLGRVQKIKAIKRIKETDAIFENVKLANREAGEDPECLRMSLDSEAKLKIGEFSRGGQSRDENTKALDHAMKAKARPVPFGMLEVVCGLLTISFGTCAFKRSERSKPCTHRLRRNTMMWTNTSKPSVLEVLVGLWFLGLAMPAAAVDEVWPQYKFDCRHSGDAADRDVTLPLGLTAAAPLGDAIFTAPVVADGRVYAVDGSGAAYCFDGDKLRVLWKRCTAGGMANCGNVSSPALAGRYLHFGTTAGCYYVLDAADGSVVREIRCGESIFSAPVVGNNRVYFATLGARVYALTLEGALCWTWDFVKEQLDFDGDRWSGDAWAEHLKGRVTGKEQFLCSRDIALDGNTLVIPAGGSIVWLEDAGAAARLHRLHRPHTATFGLSIGADGTVYRQSHWLDNGGQIEILRGRDTDFETAISRSDKPADQLVGMIDRAFASAKAGVDYVPGTKTSTGGGLLSFSSVSLRGQDVYRCRPEEGFGLCRHAPGQSPLAYPGCYPAISSPILLRDKAVYGGLDGVLYVVPLAGDEAWSFKTPFGKAISAPVAVCDGRIYFGCEDGYLYALGAGGNAPLPTQDLKLWKIRTPLAGKWADPKYDRFASFADWGNTNVSPEQLQLPLRVDWIRRFEGSAKHFSSCGGGRMYTHTAEGQVFAVEQATGRPLWRRYFPGVHICYTTPLYHQERVLVPQAGRKVCRLRCLDAATGDLLWEAPFAGSPSWSRQMPPVVYRNLAIYMFGTGRYDDDVPEEEKVRWLWSHGGVKSYPSSHRPMLRAYDLATGKEAWARDFSEFGSGGDESGICLMGDTLYYSCFFGYAAERRAGTPGLQGITAAIDPLSGRTLWLSTKHSIRSGCTISGAEGRLYLGGYCSDPETRRPHVWCLNAQDGSLVWRSEPLPTATHVVAIAPTFLFVHTHGSKNFLLDKQTGKTLATFAIKGHRCSRLTLTGRYLLGPNLDVIDLGDPQDIKLLSTGPRLDPSECIGAIASNGRVFYTGHGGGLQLCLAPAADKPATQTNDDNIVIREPSRRNDR